MCEQSEISYLDGEVVWVKLGSCWWPGEVVAPDKLPPDVLPSFRKPPIAVVKFFQEDTYEYVKNLSSIYKYNCSRKNEFINKGLYMYRTKHGHMEKFPEDVIRAEKAVGGDITILTRDEFQETKKESYANLFGDPAKKALTPMSGKRGRGRGRPPDSSRVHTPSRKIQIDKPNYKVHILVQGSQTPPVQAVTSETASTPSTSRAGSEGAGEGAEENKSNVEQPISTPSTPKISSSGIYSCHACAFTTTRLNVLILHNKTHSVTFMPYTPSPIKKKVTKTPKSSPVHTKTPKARKSKPEKTEKSPKNSTSQKRAAEDKPVVEVKKTKTDEEIKSSLLADWDIDDDSNDESSVIVMKGSPEVAAPAESPAVAASADLPEAQVPSQLQTPITKSPEDLPVAEKPECSSDSKYEFCEDEDWPEEADVGRKIPRVKNPKRKEDTKSISLDEDDVAREVAELLNKTTVPELPSAPEPLKVEENFPEPSIVKSPDKKPDAVPQACNSPEMKSSIDTQPTKTIFKTKTFFRSRHSRSQDAIGKYVAEQLSAERIDTPEDINGSEILSPETRISPPTVEPVKVARLAPKIQLKKMKAEAAQMRERDKISTDIIKDDFYSSCSSPSSFLPSISTPEYQAMTECENADNTQENKSMLEETKEDSANNVTQIEEEHLNQTDDVLLDQLQEPSHTKESISDHIDLNLEENSTALNLEEKNTVDPNLDKGTQNMSSACDIGTHSLIVEGGNDESGFKNVQINEEKDVMKPLPVDVSLGIETGDLKQHDEMETEAKELNNLHKEEKEISEEVTNNSSNERLDSDNKYSKDEDLSISKTDIAMDVSEPLPNLQVTQQEPPENTTTHYTNESTASAVDALLTVSRDSDKVTKMISNDLPEDLFEEDNKDNGLIKSINGFIETTEPENNLNIPQAMETDANDSEPHDVVCEEVVEDINKDVVGTNENLLTTSEQNISNYQNIQSDTTLENAQKDVQESVPSESDLVIAETLINLPSTTIQSKPNTELRETSSESIQFPEETLLALCASSESNQINDDLCIQENKEISSNHITNTENISTRFETEHEKSENLNAAQSLVQMSESVEHKINVGEIKTNNKKEKPKLLAYKCTKEPEIIISSKKIEQKSPLLSSDMSNESPKSKSLVFETTTPKLLKILEEPSQLKTTSKQPAKLPATMPNIITKQVIVPGKEKILNFDVGKSGLSSKSHSPKQKIIIRRTNPPHKNLLNNVTEVTTPDKIILSRTNNVPQDGSSVQTYTIQTATEAPTDPNTIVIQQKIRKISKTQPTKVQKIKAQPSIVPLTEAKAIKTSQNTEDVMFDINSMPIVLSDDILTPESIEKMPIVMPDGNIITNTSNPQKVVKPKPTIIENEKVAISSIPQSAPKQEFKTLIMNPASEVNKATTPNILSKSSKLRGTKMLVIDKTGKQKIIMTKQPANTEPPIKESPSKPQTPLIQGKSNQNPSKPEKFILIPSSSSPRPAGRQQKIVIDPQTGKAHLLVGKGPDSPIHIAENKPVAAKLMPSVSDTPGNTVMIITNAQGAQSRIVLKPEHEKILFPNKQQPNLSQLKTITHRTATNSSGANKTVVTSVGPAKNPARIVPKQKNAAIITSKGQLIVGGRVATTAQNIAPMPEIRPAPKRTVTSEPKKIVQNTQKNTTEPLIFLQQKSGAMMQLTAAQFEHLQRTGQIIQKTIPAPARENKIVLQKTINISPNEPIVSNVQKRVRKHIVESPAPTKKVKQDIAIAPAPTPAPVPALCPISNPVAPSIIPPTISTTTPSASAYPNLENFEELLPSTAIARQPEPVPPQPEPPAPALSDGQLLAVPGEHFGGPAGSFYLCVEDNGTFTPIDNRPLVLENNQLVPMPEPPPVLVQQPERRDILEAALANSDVFHGETTRDEAPDFRDLNANVSVHCRVSETSTTLNQPIMTPVEVPTKVDSEPAVPSNLEDGLAVIGVTPHTVPTSLELPITVTDPRIAPKTTDPLSSNNYGTTLLPSPNTELSFVSAEVDVPMGGPISMPLLTEEEAVGKSMPILTDDVSDRIVSSVESTSGSPSSIDVRDTETDDGSQWSRRLLTPCSDTSEMSTEIPLQPKMQLSVSDIK